jgi:flagellin-specific chaperone FliS
MKNNELETKVNELVEQISTMKNKNRSSEKITIIVYLILVIFVFFYTSFLMNWIKSTVTPDSISAYSRNLVEDKMLTPENHKKIITMCYDNIPIVAEKLVQVTNEKVIPNARVKIKNIINVQVDKLIKHLETNLLPKLHFVMDKNLKALKKHSSILDEDVGKELSKVLVANIDKELDSIINHKVKKRINMLADELNKIALKPIKNLTAKEGAERRVIIYWIFLLENDEISSRTIFHDLIEQGNQTYKAFLSDLKVTDK